MAQTAFAAEAEGNVKLARRLHLAIDGEVRTQQGFSEMERLSLSAALSYRFNKYVKADAGYMLLYRYIPEELTGKGNTVSAFWSPRHRYWLSATGTLRAGRIDLSLRERLQFTHRPLKYVEKYSGTDGHRMTDEVKPYSDELMLRSRIAAKWNIRHCPLTPFVSLEMYNDTRNDMDIDQMRYAIGTDLKLDKRNSLSLTYCYKDKKDDDDEPGQHIISLSFSHDF